jgi:hypothetical protein
MTLKIVVFVLMKVRNLNLYFAVLRATMDNVINYIFLLSSSLTVYEVARYVVTIIPSLIICVKITHETKAIIVCSRIWLLSQAVLSI